jgi:hypothetical protein
MRRSYAISPHPGRFCSSSGAAIESLRHFFILKVRSANLDFTQLANNAALTLNAGAPQDLPSSTFSIDSAAQRFTAGSENRPVIAAVNRCATQNQVRHRIVLEAAKPYLTRCWGEPKYFRHSETGQAPSLHEFFRTFGLPEGMP